MVQHASSTTMQYVIAIVLIVTIAMAGVVLSPEQSISVLAFCGSILIALLAILKSQSEVHEAVNSKMDRLLDIVEASALARGVVQGAEDERERVRVESETSK